MKKLYCINDAMGVGNLEENIYGISNITLYGRETWTIGATEKKRLLASEI